MLARDVYFAAVFIVLMGFGFGALNDVLLALEGGKQATISAYLRLHPQLFWWPAGAIVVGIILLGLHLFVIPLFLR